MRSEYVKLALSSYPQVADNFIQTYSVRSKQNPELDPRIHKKGSTIALFEKAQKTGSYEFIEELALALKTTAKPSILQRIYLWTTGFFCCSKAQNALAHRKASDLLINLYRWSEDEPKFKADPKIQEIRKRVFPESEKPYFDAVKKAYVDRRAAKQAAAIKA